MTKNKYVVIYKNQISPVSDKNIEAVEKKIKKAFQRSLDNDTDYFKCYNMEIKFSDYSMGKVQVLTLNSWFKDNLVLL